jgi:HrpA-like RNA helicase
MRKIILATNLAETSLTIEDVAFVIDTGRSKEKSYDPHLKTSTLQESWISQASAKQRKGRAGRCKAGVCFHLFSRRRHSSMRPFVESELIRTPLEEICLQCKQLKLAPGGPDDADGIPAFLSKAMTPPHTKSVMNALELLCALGAMDEETNELTNLGSCLSALSLEPRVGKMVIMSYLIGCAKASSSMSVAMSHKSLFSIPPPSMRKVSDMSRVKLSEYSNSDQITSLNVLRNRDIVAKRGMGQLVGWCRQNYLNYSSVTMVSQLRTVVSRELEGLGFPPCSTTGYHNRFGDTHPAILQASICAGLYPNVAYRRTGDVNFSTLTNRKAKIHLGSVNAIKSQLLSNKCQVAENQVEFVIFGEMVKGKAMFTMENTTHLVSPLPLLLLCGRLHVKQIQFAPPTNSNNNNNNNDSSSAVGVVGVPIQKSILSLDDWLVFLCEPNVASALVVLRQRLDSAFSRLTTNPLNYLSMLSPAEKDAVETLSQVLSSSHNAALGHK